MFFSFPEHVATATSHFVLVFMSAAATATHAWKGDYARTISTTVALALGVVFGAPAGAALSSRIEGRWVVRLLAVALAIVGLRLLAVAVIA